VTLRVLVKPRSARDAVDGVRDGALVVQVTALPAEGAANEALVRLLGRALGVAPSVVRILRGAAGRRKLVSVAGLSASGVRARLAAAAGAKRR
jgi:uncharacterized protein YggU (UPF0235/DUF167 family)